MFIGGTPELHAFARRLPVQPGTHRYIVALADVNLQVLAQLGGTPRHSSVIATQAVPLLTSTLGVVRAYRQALARYYDEPPSPQGLAGFVSARYAAAVLSGPGVTKAPTTPSPASAGPCRSAAANVARATMPSRMNAAAGDRKP